MEFISDNIGWLFIGGIILFAILSSLFENKGTSKTTTGFTLNYTLTAAAQTADWIVVD